jgi:hypothetical protein
VELVEIDVIGLQPLERLVDGVVDVLAIELRGVAAGAQISIVRTARDLGGDDYPVALAARLQPRAEEALGIALRLGARRDGIDLGGVDEIDAAPERAVELGVALGLGVLLAPGHAAQRDRRDFQIGPAQPAKFGHCVILLNLNDLSLPHESLG